MAHHDERTAVCKYLLQCRKGTADTSVVCYITIFIQWHVEVNAHDCLVTGKVKIFNFHFT
ncbi:Uncharacterised protein [Segatella copri]|nr:Uncharacterised protein [Segatella copri]